MTLNPRIAPLNAPYVPDVQASFDQIMPPGAPPLMLFRVLAGHERAWRKFRAGSLLNRGPLSLRERELVIDRTCALTGCEYEWGVHAAAFATAARLTETELKATVYGADHAESLTPGERVLIAAAEALHFRATLSVDEFSALRAHYDETQILEIILLAGFYRTVSYIANGLNLPLEATAARFPPQLNG